MVGAQLHCFRVLKDILLHATKDIHKHFLVIDSPLLYKQIEGSLAHNEVSQISNKLSEEDLFIDCLAGFCQVK